jgi:hypothetical protein
MEAKVKINLKEGFLELEGSEEFVSKYLELFEDKLLNYYIEDEDEQNDTVEDTKSNKNKKGGKKENPPLRRKRSIPKKIDVEEFSFEGDQNKNIPSLKDFLKDKNVDDESASKFIITVGYYITNVLNLNEFSEGNIDYAYKALGSTNRPAHLHQIIINQKNNKNWFEEGTDGNKWKLSRLGEIYVESSLKDEEAIK